MSRDFYSSSKFLYTSQAPDSGGGGSGSSGGVGGGGGGDGSGNSGMDCVAVRCAPTPGPFHYLINEQAKSLVALQELQHEVGALLEFRDLVIETFPNLRTKMAVSSAASTLTNTSNIPISRRDWEPGVRVRRRIQHKDGDSSPNRSRSNSHSGKQQPKSHPDTTSTIQDSGFSTETTSSKETHSASSTTGASGTMQPSTSKDSPVDAEDELWNLLDIIHRKGTKLRDDVEAMQGVLYTKSNLASDDSDFQRQLECSGEDTRNLRRERDILLEKLAELESENLAGRVQTSRLRADLESLLAAKIDLEEQLRLAVNQKSELNSRIHDLHIQFVSNKSEPNSPDGAKSVYSGGKFIERPTRRRRTSSVSRRLESDLHSNKDNTLDNVDNLTRLDKILGFSSDSNLYRVRSPDSMKIAAILKETNAVVLQRNLLSATIHNEALKQRLDAANTVKNDLAEKLDKVRDDNDDLKFQLEEQNIKLEGTRARVRMLELQTQKSSPSNSTLVVSATSPLILPIPRVEQLSTPSMKAMVPLPMSDDTTLQNTSSTESAHDQKTVETPKRKPSRIPLPGSMTSSKSNISTKSLTRPGSAQSTASLSGTKTPTSIPGPKTKTCRDSLTGRLKNTSDSLSKISNNSIGSTRSASICNKRDGLSSNRIRRIGSVSRGSILNDGDTKASSSTSLKLSSWNTSSLNTENAARSGLSYPDSLDGEDQLTPQDYSHPLFQTANNFLWNISKSDDYFDSINSTLDLNVSSSLKRSGEGLAECDSLEEHSSINY